MVLDRRSGEANTEVGLDASRGERNQGLDVLYLLNLVEDDGREVNLSKTMMVVLERIVSGQQPPIVAPPFVDRGAQLLETEPGFSVVCIAPGEPRRSEVEQVRTIGSETYAEPGSRQMSLLLVFPGSEQPCRRNDKHGFAFC